MYWQFVYVLLQRIVFKEHCFIAVLLKSMQRTIKQAEAKLVTCDCGHSFCFGCAENWHEPVTSASKL